MSVTTPAVSGRATLDDLMPPRARPNWIGGRIVPFMATGHRPNLIAGEIFVRPEKPLPGDVGGARRTRMINMGFAVRRCRSLAAKSFSPDVAFYDGPPPSNEMDFVPGPPTFAVEVRSKTDYGHAAEAEMAAKRADYFEAGTAVVWDVDPRAGCVHSYRADTPDQPATFLKGQQADAEPAVPGWRIAVDDLYS